MRKVRMVLLPSRVKLKYNRSINRFSYPFFWSHAWCHTEIKTATISSGLDFEMILFDLAAVQAQATTLLTETNSPANKISNYTKTCRPFREDDKFGQ
jgi:hypothetical protein